MVFVVDGNNDDFSKRDLGRLYNASYRVVDGEGNYCGFGAWCVSAEALIFVTASHCVLMETGMPLRDSWYLSHPDWPKDQRFEVVVSAIYADGVGEGVAILRPTSPQLIAAPIIHLDLAQFDPVYGDTLALVDTTKIPYQFAFGIFGAYRSAQWQKEHGSSEVVITTLPSSDGCSGGAVINSFGEVVGIVFGRQTKGDIDAGAVLMPYGNLKSILDVEINRSTFYNNLLFPDTP